MEPTESQLVAARRAARDDIVPALSIDPAVIDVAVRAAFATVPDPTELAEQWDGETDFKMGEATNRTLNQCADELRAFMRGDDK